MPDTYIENAIGGSADDTIIGNDADNIIDGRGGSDNIFADAGADTIIYDSQDAVIDGGSGVDTLLILEDNLTLDLSAMTNLDNMEVIDLSDLTNSISITANAIISATDVNNTLFIFGGDNDTVTFSDGGWSDDGQVDIGGTLYDEYSNASVSLLVDADVNSSLI